MADTTWTNDYVQTIQRDSLDCLDGIDRVFKKRLWDTHIVCFDINWQFWVVFGLRLSSKIQ